MIEQAALRDERRSDWHPLANAPARIIAAVNRKRAAAGLDRILSRDERLEAEARDVVARAAAAAAAASGAGVWIDPRSRLAPRDRLPSPNGYFAVGGRPTAAPTRVSTSYETSVLLVVGHGLARGHGSPGTIGKRIDRLAYGSPDELNASPGWTLRNGHHGGIVAFAGPSLRAVPSQLAAVFRWVPDLTRDDHRELVRRIDAGQRNVSANYVVSDRRVMRLPEPTDVVLAARLVHVALLPADDEPAFPAAFATVFRNRPDTADELRRQVAEVEKAARWRAAEAERVGR